MVNIKRLFSIMTVLVLALALYACEGEVEEQEQNNEDDVIIVDPVMEHTKTVTFENLAKEYLLDDMSIELYFIEEHGLPYIDIESFLMLLGGGESQGAIDYEQLDIIIDGQTLTIENFYSQDEEDEDFDENIVIEDVTYSMIFDFSTNSATVSHFNFFGSFTESTQTDFGSGLTVADYKYEFGDAVTFDFGAYDLGIYAEKDVYLIPFHLANLFFSGQMFDVYYNGDELYGFDTYQRNNESIKRTLLDSSYNGEQVNFSLREDTYNYLTFTMDYFYGLKADRNVDTYRDEIEQFPFLRLGFDHYSALNDFVYELDDLHTSFLSTGYYQPSFNPRFNMSRLGPRVSAFYDQVRQLQTYQVCGIGDTVYYDDGRVARVPIQGFNAKTGDEFEKALDNLEPGVTDVIVDLSCNTGGIVGGMIQVLGFMTDELIPIHGLNAGDGATSTTYYESESVARDYNWHVMSSSITYSAGNMMVTIVKEMELGTLIGLDSAGGAASIRLNILPTGAMYIMSSSSIITDANYRSVEEGIEVDVTLTIPELVDENAILKAIGK